MAGWNIDATGRHTFTLHTTADAPFTGNESDFIDSTNKKYGYSSVSFNGARYLKAADHADWDLGTHFTIQCWFKMPSGGSTKQHFISKRDGGNADLWMFGIREDAYSGVTGRMIWEFNCTDGDIKWRDGDASDPGGWNNNQWHHYAITRNGTRWCLFMDGTLRYNTSSGRAGAIVTGSSQLRVGAIYNTYNQAYMTGNIDDLHIEKGVQRWTGTNVGSQYFVPDSLGEAAVTGNSVLLMNFNETVYEVAGTVSDNAKIWIIDEDTETVEYSDIKAAGAYSVNVSDNSEKSVFAVRESDGKVLGYGRVIPSLV